MKAIERRRRASRCRRRSSGPSRTSTAKKAARKKNLVSFTAGRLSRQIQDEVGELPDARAAVEALAASSGASGVPSRAPARQRSWSDASAVSDRLDVVGRADDACPRFADQLGCGAVRRHDGEDRSLGREVLEHLPREDALPAAACLGDQQEQRVGVALQLERAAGAARTGSARADRRGQALGPFAVGCAEVADEARDDVEA